MNNVFKLLEKQVKRTKKRLTLRAQAQVLCDGYFKEQAGLVHVASVNSGVVILATPASALVQEIEGFHKQALLLHLRNAGMSVSEIRAKLVSR